MIGRARITRAELSIGMLDLVTFEGYAHAFPRHSHEEFTIGVFGRDNGSIGYRGRRWRAAEGSVLAIPPDEPHDAEPLEHSGWTYRSMYPSPELIALAMGVDDGPLAPPFFRQPIVDDERLATTIRVIHDRLGRDDAGLRTESVLLEMLETLVRRYGGGCGIDSVDKPIGRAVATAREYLNDNYARPVRLKTLATVCGVSPYHLVRSFNSIVGMAPHAYLTQVRASRARALLAAGNAVSDVAYRCGFCDQSHLTRTFKRIFGITPGAYHSAGS